MKVIVNNVSPLTVEDRNGNVLFQWLPQENLKFKTELEMKPLSEEDKKYIYQQLQKAQFTYL